MDAKDDGGVVRLVAELGGVVVGSASVELLSPTASMLGQQVGVVGQVRRLVTQT